MNLFDKQTICYASDDMLLDQESNAQYIVHAWGELDKTERAIHILSESVEYTAYQIAKTILEEIDLRMFAEMEDLAVCQ